MNGVFPDFYVLDLFEYQLDGENYIDVVEFNPIHSSGLYLYNSCMMKSDDILHKNIKKVSYEFIDKIEEYTTIGKVFNGRTNLYNIPNSFSNHLRSICLNGNIEITWSYDAEISESDFARHNPIYSLSEKFEPVENEDDLLKESSDLDDEKLEKLIAEINKKLQKSMK